MTAQEKLQLIDMLLEHVWPERANVFDPESSWTEKDRALRAMAACLADIRQVVHEGREGGA